jgi:hypothetical protein
MPGDEQSKTGYLLSAENKMLRHSGASQSNLGDLTNSGKDQSNSGDSIDSGSNTLNTTGHNQSMSGDLIWAESNILTTGSQQSKSGDSADAGSNNLLIVDEASDELTKSTPVPRPDNERGATGNRSTAQCRQGPESAEVGEWIESRWVQQENAAPREQGKAEAATSRAGDEVILDTIRRQGNRTSRAVRSRGAGSLFE